MRIICKGNEMDFIYVSVSKTQSEFVCGSWMGL